MKREIKFRGFSTDTDQWVYGFYRQYPVYKSCGKCLKRINHFIDIMGDKPHSEFINPDTVGQYTGLKDKNDVEIYEGDIVEYKGALYPIVEEVGCYSLYDQSGEIEEDGCLCDYLLPLSQVYIECLDVGEDTLYNIEIKGNIHDNPELLKGGNQ